MFCSLLFSTGIFLIFAGFFSKRKPGRFYEKSRNRKRQLANILLPFTYPEPIQFLLRSERLYSLAITEELLKKAGCPWDLKAKHVMLVKILLPLLAGGGLVLYYGMGFPEKMTGGMPVYLVFLVMAGTFALPSFVIGVLIKCRQSKVEREQGLFTEIVFMCLKAKLTLREALEEAGKTTDFLKPYLTVCLNEWVTDRLMALNNLKRNVGTDSFQLLTELLIQAATIGDEKIADYLQENKRMEDELRNLSISAKSKVRPLLLTIQMALPFIVILTVLFYPLVTQVENLLKRI